MIDIEQLSLVVPVELVIDEPMEPIDKKQICPYRIIVDTREQAPFRFLGCEPYPMIELCHVGLQTGDYSIEGFEKRITIERKSVGDLLGSITAGRERFEREFERMNQLEFAAVVVEGQLSDVLRHSRDNTNLQLKSIVGTFDSWRIHYPRVHWIFCLDRRHAELQTLSLLNFFWRQDQERLKDDSKQKNAAATGAISVRTSG